MIALEKKQALTAAEQAQSSPAKIQPRFLKIATAVTYSGIGRSTIYELLNAAKIKSHKIGNARVIDRESLDTFISSQPSQ